MVLKRPVLLSFPHPHWYRHLRHAVCLGCCSSWNYMLCGCCSRSVFPFPSLLSASARKRNNTIVGTQNCRLLQPVNRCCSHCNEIQGTTISLVQSLVPKIAASWAAVPAGCANEFQTMLWGCSSRHSKDHAVGLFQPAFHVYLNAGRQRHIQ